MPNSQFRFWAHPFHSAVDRYFLGTGPLRYSRYPPLRDLDPAQLINAGRFWSSGLQTACNASRSVK